MKVLSLFLLLLLSPVQTNKEFEQYILSIPELKIGYSISSEDQFLHMRMESMFIPEGATVVGRLPSNNEFHYVLYTYSADIVLPVLEKYDLTGKRIAQYNLFDYAYCTDIKQANQQSEFVILDSFSIEKINYVRNLGKGIMKRDTLFLR